MATAQTLSRTLVTGATGFIGSHLCEALVAEGVATIGVDGGVAARPHGETRAIASNLRQIGVTLVDGNLLDLPLAPLLDGVSTIFHLAARTSVRASFGDALAGYWRDNVDVTDRLATACAHHPTLRSFVYASSSSVYGSAGAIPTAESAPTLPRSPYASTKLAGELRVLAGAMAGRLPASSARLFTVYGPRQRPDMGFARFIAAMHGGEPLEILGDGRQQRDFTEVSDIVSGLIAIAMHAPVGETFNLASGTQASILETIELLEQIAGFRANVVTSPTARGDVRATWSDCSKAREQLEWVPRVTLREGLERQWRAHTDR